MEQFKKGDIVYDLSGNQFKYEFQNGDYHYVRSYLIAEFNFEHSSYEEEIEDEKLTELYFKNIQKYPPKKLKDKEVKEQEEKVNELQLTLRKLHIEKTELEKAIDKLTSEYNNKKQILADNGAVLFSDLVNNKEIFKVEKNSCKFSSISKASISDFNVIDADNGINIIFKKKGKEDGNLFELLSFTSNYNDEGEYWKEYFIFFNSFDDAKKYVTDNAIERLVSEISWCNLSTIAERIKDLKKNNIPIPSNTLDSVKNRIEQINLKKTKELDKSLSENNSLLNDVMSAISE